MHDGWALCYHGDRLIMTEVLVGKQTAAPPLQGTESLNGIRPSRIGRSPKPFFQKFASLSRQYASFGRCGRVLISHLRGVQHPEPQILQAFGPSFLLDERLGAARVNSGMTDPRRL
uniref:Uncharacterized protein n=1 Tax=Rangifer tarandus platyrhynchus TaxID=3082113 RepID=A0ACB0ESP0_RANTA|nr:unnamed protein product [Rangifer tarandus platyrhynchus]